MVSQYLHNRLANIAIVMGKSFYCSIKRILDERDLAVQKNRPVGTKNLTLALMALSFQPVLSILKNGCSKHHDMRIPNHDMKRGANHYGVNLEQFNAWKSFWQGQNPAA